MQNNVWKSVFRNYQLPYSAMFLLLIATGCAADKTLVIVFRDSATGDPINGVRISQTEYNSPSLIGNRFDHENHEYGPATSDGTLQCVLHRSFAGSNLGCRADRYVDAVVFIDVETRQAWIYNTMGNHRNEDVERRRFEYTRPFDITMIRRTD